MRKSVVVFASGIFYFLLLFLAEANAGTILVGAKGWYAEWDSAFDKAFADAITTALPGFSSTVKPGTGFLVGPTAGYQSDNGDWSLSVAYMAFSSFTNKTEYEFSGVTVETKTEMQKRDLDIALSYSLSDYFKVFAGYKYVTCKYDVNFDDGSDFYEVKMTSSIPTAGAGLAFPLSEEIALGLQFGLLYVFPEYKISDEKIKTENGYGISIEPNLTFLLSESIMTQLGIRYQVYNVKFADPSYPMETTKNDQLVGVTLAVMYLFNLQ